MTPPHSASAGTATTGEELEQATFDLQAAREDYDIEMTVDVNLFARLLADASALASALATLASVATALDTTPADAVRCAKETHACAKMAALYEEDIEEHLPSYVVHEGTDDESEAGPREVIEYAGDQIRELTAAIAERTREVERLREALISALAWVNDTGDQSSIDDVLSSMSPPDRECAIAVWDRATAIVPQDDRAHCIACDGRGGEGGLPFADSCKACGGTGRIPAALATGAPR